MSPEVLIYIQSVKNHFNTDEERRSYFYSLETEEEFFKTLGSISEENLKKNGEPALSMLQFESLRKSYGKPNSPTDINNNSKLFFYVPIFEGHYGYYSLN